MSEQSPTTHQRPAADRLRSRINTFNVARGQRVVGPAEVVALAGSMLIFLLVIVSYLYFLVPARSRVDTLAAERSLLQTTVRSSQSVATQDQSTQAAVQTIAQSLDDFENNTLVSINSGRMGLYDNLNLLIRKNGLRNTSGPTYTALEPTGSKANTTGTKSANTKWQSIYPGIAISVTVEGQYTNLRRFVQDIESNKQFVIINSVELERSTEANTSTAVSAEGVAAPPPSSLVSLRLDMATYFQRGSRPAADAVVH